MAAPLDPRRPNPPAEALERVIDQILKDQPPRPAPASLQARVLAEIERRAALPWWHNSFLHWPLAVRMLFILVSLGIVKLALSGLVLLISHIHSQPVVDSLAKSLSWAETGADVMSKTVGLATLVLHAIPTHWLYAGIGLAATLYLALVALGATAYRTLYVNK